VKNDDHHDYYYDDNDNVGTMQLMMFVQCGVKKTYIFHFSEIREQLRQPRLRPKKGVVDTEFEIYKRTYPGISMRTFIYSSIQPQPHCHIGHGFPVLDTEKWRRGDEERDDSETQWTSVLNLKILIFFFYYIAFFHYFL